MKKPRFTPIDPDTPWPSRYSVIAVLPLDEAQMQERLGIPSMRGIEDGLGPWIAFGGLIDGHMLVEFVYYEWAPEPRGFEVRVEMDIDDETALDRILRFFELDRTQLV